MTPYVVFLSIPGLRASDLQHMPHLAGIADDGAVLPLIPTFPCVTLPTQVSMMTGVLPQEHGVLANGFYWREGGDVEMWTAWNDVVETPQVWDRLRRHDASLTSAVWFPMWVKGAGADYVCVPAPIHNPDGSESLWCYTKPEELYPELKERFGHFPLMNFWGPLANIQSTEWIVESAMCAAEKFQPRFSDIYLPHLDYAAQKHGPDSPEALQALSELDAVIGRLIAGYNDAGLTDVLWIAAGEYVITPVTGAVFPNRLLRAQGLLSLQTQEDGTELLSPADSRAWALVDHQFAHVFVRDDGDVERVAQMFRREADIAEVLAGEERNRRGVNHPRAGDIVLIARPEKWLAYYWWEDDARAPAFARTVDIHSKPGYDPVELFIDPATKTTPLDASLVRGSHGYPAEDEQRQTVLLCSETDVLPAGTNSLSHTDLAGLLLRNFQVK